MIHWGGEEIWGGGSRGRGAPSAPLQFFAQVGYLFLQIPYLVQWVYIWSEGQTLDGIVRALGLGGMRITRRRRDADNGLPLLDAGPTVGTRCITFQLSFAAGETGLVPAQ